MTSGHSQYETSGFFYSYVSKFVSGKLAASRCEFRNTPLLVKTALAQKEVPPVRSLRICWCCSSRARCICSIAAKFNGRAALVDEAMYLWYKTVKGTELKTESERVYSGYV